MTRRIAWWALAGFLIACGWVVFFWVTPFHTHVDHTLWTIVEITAPASLLRTLPMKYYWFIVLNAAAYSLVGVCAELVRRAPQSSRP